jgi:hypothetical protein
VLALLLGEVVVVATPLPVSKAGKSSDWRAVWEDWDAIALESPELVANVFTSCFACNVEVSWLGLEV